MSKYIYILFSPLFINGSISNACVPVAYSTHLYTFSLVSTSRTNWAASQLCSRVRHGSFIYCDFELLQSHLVRSPPYRPQVWIWYKLWKEISGDQDRKPLSRSWPLAIQFSCQGQRMLLCLLQLLKSLTVLLWLLRR